MLGIFSYMGTLQSAAHAEQDLPLIIRQERDAQRAQHARDLREQRAAARRALQAQRAQGLEQIVEGDQPAQANPANRIARPLF